MKLRFEHPRSSDVYGADVEAACTGQEAIDGLVGARFLAPATAERPYGLVLKRTKAQVLPGAKLGDVGVKEGDLLAVTQEGQGARRDR